MTDSAASFEPREEPASPIEPPRALYEAHLDYVWNALRRFGISGSEVEDLTQEVFLRAFRDWDRFDPSRDVRPWLCGIAYHVAIDLLRRQGHMAAATGDLPPEVASNQPTAEQAAAHAQERRILDEILGSLDPDRRAVLVMHEVLGHTAPEIAEALQVPLNTVYSRLRLARVAFDAAVATWKQQERRP